MSPAPLTRERLAAHLARRGYNVVRDPDGDLTGHWDEHRFWFFLIRGADILQVRGRGGRTLAPEHRAPALLAVNDWNRDKIWPKCYLRAEGGRLVMYTELSVPLRPGVTDDQLDLVIDGGLGAGLRFFTSVPQHLLDPLESGPEEHTGPDGPGPNGVD